MANYKGWNSEDRYFTNCPMCGKKEAMRKMVLLKKADVWNCRNLTYICQNCYVNVLDFIGINDVEFTI